MTRGLTPTEERVVRLAVAGRTNADVASELAISRQTVEWHLWRAYRKLGVHSREQLAEVLAATPPLGPDAAEDEPSDPLRKTPAGANYGFETRMEGRKE